MIHWTRSALLGLQLACGGLSMSQPGCTSQTAIAIVTRDAGTSMGDTSPALPDLADAIHDTAPLPDATAASDALNLFDVTTARDTLNLPDVVAVPDALNLSDAKDVADTGRLLDVLGTPDVLVPPDTAGAPPDASLADSASRDTATEAASAKDTPPSVPATLFSDAFGGGYEVNWLLSESSDGPVTNARDGTNAIVTLDSSQDDYTRLRCNLTGDKFTAQDITASMRVRVDQAPSSTRSIRLDVRQSKDTANIFYAVGAVVTIDGTITNVSIFKKVPDGTGNYTICELAAGPLFATPIAMNQWRRIKLTISGTSSVRLVAFFEDLQVATFTDDCASTLTATNGAQVANGGCLADQTGLGIQVEKGLKASVDDVLVTGP